VIRDGEQQTIKVVDTFKYLGVLANNNGTAEDDVSRRISIAACAFGKKKEQFLNQYIPIKHRVADYIVFVVLCLLQCIEVRSLLQADVDRLEKYNFRCLRKMLG